LPIVVCYEHGQDTLLHRLNRQASVDNPDSPSPTDVKRDQMETIMLAYYDQAQTTEGKHELGVDWILRRLPAAERAW